MNVIEDVFNDNKSKGQDYYIFKRLMKYARPYSFLVVISFLMLIIVIGAELLQPIIIGRVVKILADVNLTMAKDYSILVKLAGILVVLIVSGSVTQYFQAVLLKTTGQKILFDIRNEVFNHIQLMEIDFFNKIPIGKLVTRVANDTETLNEMYTNVIIISIKNILLLVGITVAMMMLSVRLTLYIYMVMPILAIFTIIFRRYSKKIFQRIRENVAKVNAYLSEHISGMKIIQIFAREEAKYDEFVKINSDLNRANKDQILAFGLYGPSIYMLRLFATAITIYFGARYIKLDVIDIGILIAFINYINRFFNPVQQLAEQFNVFQSAMASAERLFELLDRKPANFDSENAIDMNDIKGEIEFKNVWFAYNDEDWILKDVSFKILPGETAAFVGETGAGKTTILSLIGKYYNYQKGDILIDGVSIRDIKTKSVRGYVGQMLQDVFIFTGDIKSNIKLLDNEIKQEEVEDAAKYVNAHEFIERLPNKYNEKVYERGATLSTGQRQLLSFARTLVRKPRILILDEATSNIDTNTEKLIQDALEKIMKGRTTLVVAHRLSTIQKADKIVVLKSGKVMEVGSHDELNNKKGYYHKLVQLQYNKTS